MIKSIKKKITAILLLTITLISNVIPIIPTLKSIAVNDNYVGKKLDIVYIGETPHLLKHRDLAGQQYVNAALTGYYENGTFYPAYCIEKDKPGVDKTREYSVTLSEIMADKDTYNKVWRTVTAGYPYHTPEELGVSDWRYAFQATKLAIYCVLGQSELDKFYADTAEGQAIVDLIHRLVNEGLNGTSTYRTPVANVNKSGNLTLSGNYYIQNYTISSNLNIKSYDIAITGFPSGTITTNTSGTSKSTFNAGETFQVRIPKNNVETGDINGRVRATVSTKSYAVFYGTCATEEWQDYAVTGDPISLTSASTNMDLKGNTASIEIKKVDEETNEPIANTTFQLSKKDGTIIGTATTDSNGIVKFDNLYQATYVIKEIKSNDNYVVMQETIDVDALYNKTITKIITNKHKKGNLSVSKVDKDNNKIALGNVSFDLFSYEFNKVIGTYITNVDGEINIDNLRIGQYSLIEKSTGKWYNLADNTDVNIEWNTTTDTTIENELKKGKIRVTKVDLDNNEIAIPNATFQVLDDKGKVLEEIITNENGIAETSRFAIRDYATLILKETKTDKWYVLNDKEIKVELKENDVVNIQVENELKKGQIKVIKVDLDNNEVKLKGVEFNVIDEKGNIVDKLITDENGEAVSKKLPINQQYKVQESKTLQDYVLNEEIKIVTLEQDKITDITFTNELKKGQVRVIKVDLDNNEIKLKGVEFNILDEKENIVDKLITDENGEAVSKRLPVNQEYTLQEIKTLENYVLNEATKIITLQPDEITNITFENEKIKGYIEITKVSEDDNQITCETKGTLLEGATFEIYSDTDELVDTIITDNTGKATSKLLEYGKYYVLEKDTGSDYYLLNTDRYEISISENLVKVPITIENKSVEIGLDIDKNGIIQAQPNDEIKYGFNSLKNTSNVSLDNFTWIDNLPYEYIRITKLFTGTYNEDLDYIVKYKTNKSEDYIKFGKYNTQKNNYIDFTKVELLEDEYITDYKVEFGTVMPGFEAIEKPFIFAKVLPTVKADDKWINNTSLTGNYKEHKLEDKADWTTISYAKELKIKKLPKTGF